MKIPTLLASFAACILFIFILATIISQIVMELDVYGAFIQLIRDISEAVQARD